MSNLTESVTNTPGSTIKPLDEHGSAVRFETQCVVIPEPVQRSRRPRVVTKSYALPLWKRRTPSAGHSQTSTLPEDASFEENRSHHVLRVPLPILSLKPRSMTRSVDELPLPPCLVHRPSPGPSCSSTLSLTRHARIPRKPSPSRSDMVTVPLRPCCAACQSTTEAALADGDAWPVHFSRGASRRRSLSADGRTTTVAGSATSASYGDLGIPIRVDEIDKRRRSSDTGPLSGPLTTNSGTLWSDNNNPKAKVDCRVSFIPGCTAMFNSSATDSHYPPSPTRVIPATPRIPEEDDDENENELFPLPSPKRTPATSPVPSPAGSLSSLAVAQANQSSATSPSTCSGDSAGPHTSKPLFLAPPRCSSSSLSLPGFSESVIDLTLSEDPPRPSSPHLLSEMPSLSGRLRSRPPSPRISSVLPVPTDSLPSAADRTLPKTPRSHKPQLSSITTASSPGSSQSSTSPHNPSPRARLPWRSKRSASAGVVSPTLSSPTSTRSPSTSPNLSTPAHSKSFSTSSPRHVIADVISGVGIIGCGGMGPRM